MSSMSPYERRSRLRAAAVARGRGVPGALVVPVPQRPRDPYPGLQRAPHPAVVEGQRDAVCAWCEQPLPAPPTLGADPLSTFSWL